MTPCTNCAESCPTPNERLREFNVHLSLDSGEVVRIKELAKTPEQAILNVIHGRVRLRQAIKDTRPQCVGIFVDENHDA